jgi:hypothetical protein
VSDRGRVSLLSLWLVHFGSGRASGPSTGGKTLLGTFNATDPHFATSINPQACIVMVNIALSYRHAIEAKRADHG